MDRNEKIKVISQAIYDDYIKKGWKNVSIYDCEVKAIHYVDTEIIVKKLTLTDVSQQRELLNQYNEFINTQYSYNDLSENDTIDFFEWFNCG
jgi:hypothetical protein